MGCTYTNPYFTQHIDIDSIKVIVEAGACMGESTVAMSKFYKNAFIYAFEPDPDMAMIADERIANNDNAALFSNALWNCVGDIDFYRVNLNKSLDKTAGNSSFFKWNPTLYKKPDKINFQGIIQEKIKVFAEVLDYFMGYVFDKVDLLCMDCQGAELNILKGAEETLKSIRYIITEVNYKPQYEGSCVYEEIVDFLNQRGFVIVAEPGTDIDPKDKVFENVLFARK